jgi:hypothetical protein
LVSVLGGKVIVGGQRSAHAVDGAPNVFVEMMLGGESPDAQDPAGEFVGR